MSRGLVRWFSNAHGYGFIQDADGVDVFVHYSAVKMNGYRTLQDGEEVEFEPVEGAKGRHAVVVVPKNAQ